MLILVYYTRDEALYRQQIRISALKGQECERCRTGASLFESYKVTENKKGVLVSQSLYLGYAFNMEHQAYSFGTLESHLAG